MKTTDTNSVLNEFGLININLAEHISFWRNESTRHSVKIDIYKGESIVSNTTQFNIDFKYCKPNCPFTLYISEKVQRGKQYSRLNAESYTSDSVRYSIEFTPISDLYEHFDIYVYIFIGDSMLCHNLNNQDIFVISCICARITYLIEYLQLYNNDTYKVISCDDSVDAFMHSRYPRQRILRKEETNYKEFIS